MKKINTDNWKKYQIKELFVAQNTGNILSRDVVDGSGLTPYVTASAYNNGVVAYIDASAYTLIPGHCILIGGKTFTMTYQKEPFVSNDSHNFEIHLINNIYSDKVYFFLITVIRASLRSKYEWSDAVTKDKFLDDYIYLPVNSEGNPDWIYMEDYISNLDNGIQCKLKSLIDIKNSNKNRLNISTWEKFPLSKLFRIVKGSRLTKSEMKDGDIAYIGASSFNNGITNHISNKEHIHPAGCLTVTYNGSDIGRTFYHDYIFWATDDVNVLYPNFEINKYIALFIAPIIKSIGQNYVYKDKWQIEEMKESLIPLPTKNDHTPDWEYMADYMKSMESRSSNMLNVIPTI